MVNEVEDMVDCLKFNKFCRGQPQERMPKRKFDEKRGEIKIPKIKKQNDADHLFSSIIEEEKEEEPECDN